MFEELFEGPIARARQRERLLPDERRRFLSHLQTRGYAHSSLRAIACELIVIAARLDLSGSEPFDASGVETAARRWARYQVRRHDITDPALSTRNFRYWAEQRLRYLGRWNARRHSRRRHFARGSTASLPGWRTKGGSRPHRSARIAGKRRHS
jgi:integrase/recombinase XerD